MATGDDGPDGDAEEGRVLSPEELDIADDEHVEVIDDGRYVVSSDVRTDADVAGQSDVSASGPPEPESDAEPDGSPEREPAPERTQADPEPTPELTDASVHEWLEASMADSNSRYGFDVTAKFDGRVSQQGMVSNDIITVFESLMLWYARQVDSDTPVEEVLGILLSESNVPVRYPPESLQSLVEASDLGPEDSIGELLEAVGDDDGVQL